MTTTGDARPDATAAPAAADDPAEQRVLDWVRAELGGRVVHVARQPHWRPTWVVDVEVDGTVLPLWVRGDRGAAYGDAVVFPLEHEVEVLRTLEAYDVPVPHVYGICPEPRAIVMERSQGRPDLSTATSDEERRAVADQLVAHLVRIHAIPPAELEARGFECPTDPDRLALNLFDRFLERYREGRPAPDPGIEFVAGWVRRNVPRHRTRPSLVTGDSGQFLFDSGKLTALLDLEYAFIGDAAFDLASLRLRDLYEPFGDLAHLFRRYEELSATPLDLDVIDFHTVEWALCASMSIVKVLHDPPPEMDFVRYLGWYVDFVLFGLRVIAERTGTTLTEPDLPEPRASRYGPAFRSLTGNLAAMLPDGEFDAYLRGVTANTAGYLQVADELGEALARDDAADVAALVGDEVTDWRDAETKLEALVRSAGPELDGMLVAPLYRRLARQRAVLTRSLEAHGDHSQSRGSGKVAAATGIVPLSELLGAGSAP